MEGRALRFQRRGRRRACSLVLAVLVGTGLWLGPLSAPASAHAELESTVPADDAVVDRAPAEIELEFDDRVEGDGAAVEVLGPEVLGRVHDEAVAAGYEIVHPLTDEPWGVRRFFVRTPGGVVVNVLAHG